MESDISVRPTEITRPVEMAFKAGPEYSGRTKPKWSVPFDVPTEITGILGWMESAPEVKKNRLCVKLYFTWSD